LLSSLCVRPHSSLQRGVWTHTQRAEQFFESVTGGWVGYEHNQTLVKLFSHALIASSDGHAKALANIEKDILRMKDIRG